MENACHKLAPIDPVARVKELEEKYDALHREHMHLREINQQLNAKLEKSEYEREYMKEENICLQQEKIVLQAKVDMVYLIFSGYRG